MLNFTLFLGITHELLPRPPTRFFSISWVNALLPQGSILTAGTVGEKSRETSGLEVPPPKVFFLTASRQKVACVPTLRFSSLDAGDFAQFIL